MKIAASCVVTSVYESPDNPGRFYYGFVDLSNGGTFNMRIDGELVGVAPGSQVNLDCEVRAQQFGKSLSLSYVGGAISNGHPVGAPVPADKKGEVN